jgi:predicted RNase H-like HicB family nuclease
VAGETFEETEHLMREGIEFHIEGLRADGELVPEPTTRVGEIAVSA